MAVCAPISSPYEDMGPLTDLISLDYPCEDPMSEGHVLRYWELGLYTFFGDTIQPLTVVLGTLGTRGGWCHGLSWSGGQETEHVESKDGRSSRLWVRSTLGCLERDRRLL